MADEARHVAFGVVSLKEYYAELTDAEMLERQEFAFEAAMRMRDRILHGVWEKMGMAPSETIRVFKDGRSEQEQGPVPAALFSKIVPNCKKLGLLDANDGWLREKFDTLGVIDFEDGIDTDEEYELLDEVAKDRAASAVGDLPARWCRRPTLVHTTCERSPAAPRAAVTARATGRAVGPAAPSATPTPPSAPADEPSSRRRYGAERPR